MTTPFELLQPQHLIFRKGEAGRPEIADLFTEQWWLTVPLGKVVAVVEASRRRTIFLHNAVWAYLTFLFHSQDTYKNFRIFRLSVQLKRALGDFHTVEGKLCFTPWSWKFVEMSQQVFLRVKEALSDYGVEKGLPSFEDWIHQYKKAHGDTTNREWEKCANPNCSSGLPATDTHEIFGGTAFRKRSIALGYQVEICRSCHEESEREGRREGMSNIEWWRRLWCSVIGVSYDEAYSRVASSVKVYKLRKLNRAEN